jgi:ABC-type cobalamin transport system ATPase subunit
LWEVEWQRALLAACMEQVRCEVKPSSFQVFEMLVLGRQPLDEVASTLQMSRDAVLKAKTRVLSRIREVRHQLEAEW